MATVPQKQEAAGHELIGKPVAQIDAFDKVTGRLQYAGDLKFPGVLHVKVLRSPYPHAEIVDIDTGKAEALPGVEAIVTWKDCPQKDWRDPDQNWQGPVFAKRVRFVGDEVAAVAAVDAETAERALELIEVKYEQLPHVYDIEEAVKEDAVQVRTDGNTRNSVFTWGDADKGWSESEVVVDLETHLGQQTHAPLDRCAAIAHWTKDHLGRERVTIWTGTQSSYQFRRAAVNYFDLPDNGVRVISTPMGGSFGLWWQNNYMFVTMVLAKKARKPVRLELTREEVFTTVKRRELPISRIKIGATKEGALKAIDVLHLFDNGGYGNKSDPYQSVVSMYGTENGSSKMIGVSTNLLTAGCMRGVGDVTVGYAVEVAFDMMAEKLGKNPVDFKLEHVFESGDILHTSQERMYFKLVFGKEPPPVRLTSSGMRECIRKGAEMFDWEQKWRGWGKPLAVDGAKRRGVGMAISTHISGMGSFGFNGAVVQVNSDGSVQLINGVGRMGQGADTTNVQVCAAVLGIGMEDVILFDGDTDVCPPVMPTYGSCNMHMIARATMHAAQRAKAQILELAAARFGVTADELDIRNKRVFLKREPNNAVPLKEIMSRPIEAYCATPVFVGSTSEGFPYELGGKMMMAHFAEVEVDTETGRVGLVDYVAVHDSGTVVNPAFVELQVFGGVWQGAGLGLTEDLLFDRESGAIRNPNFMDYKVLRMNDLPTPRVHFVEVYDEMGPFGAKGIGEGPNCSVTPAIANAVYNAIGVRIDPPMHPEKVLRALNVLHE